MGGLKFLDKGCLRCDRRQRKKEKRGRSGKKKRGGTSHFNALHDVLLLSSPSCLQATDDVYSVFLSQTMSAPPPTAAPAPAPAKAVSNTPSTTTKSHFRPIRDIAEAADAIPSDDEKGSHKKQKLDEGDAAAAAAAQDGNDDDAMEEDEKLEHPVEEIESYCMECGENVSWRGTGQKQMMQRQRQKTSRTGWGTLTDPRSSLRYPQQHRERRSSF